MHDVCLNNEHCKFELNYDGGIDTEHPKCKMCIYNSENQRQFHNHYQKPEGDSDV